MLAGPSGIGKSSILKMIFGNYRCDNGRIAVQHRGGAVDIAAAEPREVLDIRRHTIGYVSQFLRVVPRVPTIDVVAEPLVVEGVAREAARERAREMLARLNIGERLWSLPPSTFSGGEQQRVNIARGFISRPADPAARRADRVARRRQPRGRRRPDRGEETQGRRHGRDRSRRRRPRPDRRPHRRCRHVCRGRMIEMEESR